jgi:DNA helicase-2/ATP-dependent DNA helicase PcrA
LEQVVDYLKDLNEAQCEAVVYNGGPSLVIAGAGSGKTRVLTYKIAYLLSQGMNARSLLSLTFTNKAAKEMKERIAKLVGPDLARNLWMGTFHSIFSKILRIESATIGFSSNYTIYDSADSKSVIKSALKELNLDDQIYKVNEVLNRISMAKNNLVTPAAYFANAVIMEQDRSSRKPRIADVYKLYCLRCRKADAMDFDDLLLNTNLLFRDFPDILDKYRRMFNYILVDEYQDTNFSQYLIVNKLASLHKNVCVVGDDAQSIYSFRGAKIENILNFKNDYPEYKLFKLEQNYRSTQTIVDAANSIIAKNKSQIHKHVWSANEKGEQIKIVQAETDNEEGFIVANTILDTRMENKLSHKQFAILYRTNAQSRIFEEALRKRNIPYKVYGSLSFYQRKEIKDLLAYCRLTVNKNDDEALKRIINYPARGIGNVTIDKIEEFANANEKSIWTIISGNELHVLGLNRGATQKISGFCDLVNSFSSKLYTEDAYELSMLIAKTAGIINDLKSENSYESISRIENIEGLLNSIKEFSDANKNESSLVTLDRYLENVALLTDADTEKSEDRDKVSLMTIHSAKGLEFDYVFIAGVEEDLFPSKMSLTSQEDLEEERRLFYVALTRAGKQAVVSYAMRRYKWGTPTNCTPSRFIKDIDEKYLDRPLAQVAEQVDLFGFDNFNKQLFERKTRESIPVKQKQNHVIKTESPLNLNKKLVDMRTASRQQVTNIEQFDADDPLKIKSGMTVYHQQFGPGKVIDIEGVIPNAKAVVIFDSAGEKKLLLKFARLKILVGEE